MAQTNYRNYSDDAINPSNIKVLRELDIDTNLNTSLINGLKNKAKGLEYFIIRISTNYSVYNWTFDVVFKNNKFYTVIDVDMPFDVHYFNVTDTYTYGECLLGHWDFNLENMVYIISVLKNYIHEVAEYCDYKRRTVKCRTQKELIQSLELLAKSLIYDNDKATFWGYALNLIKNCTEYLPMTYYTFYLHIFGDEYNGKNVADYLIFSYGKVTFKN